MKTRNYIIAITAIAFMVSCSSTKVVTDQNKDTDFTKYQTFTLMKYEGSNTDKNIKINELNEKRIISAILDNAKKSGLTPSTEPDVYIYYSVGVDFQTEYQSNTSYHTPYYGRYGRRGRAYYGGGYGTSYSTTTETQTASGVISIGLVDAETEELVWISKGTKEIQGNTKKAEENINKSIDKIFEDFPIEILSSENSSEDLVSKRNENDN